MASLLFAAGILSYDAIKKKTSKRRAARNPTSRTSSFSALERDNAARIAALQSGSCFCQRSDWTGGGCEHHGYVPAAGEVGGPPDYGAVIVGHDDDVGDGAVRRGTMPPEYADGNSPLAPVAVASQGEGGSPYRYERGREEGVFAEESVGTRRPALMGEEEVRRINEERRRKGRGGSGGLRGLALRWRKG